MAASNCYSVGADDTESDAKLALPAASHTAHPVKMRLTQTAALLPVALVACATQADGLAAPARGLGKERRLLRGAAPRQRARICLLGRVVGPGTTACPTACAYRDGTPAPAARPTTACGRKTRAAHYSPVRAVRPGGGASRAFYLNPGSHRRHRGRTGRGHAGSGAGCPMLPVATATTAATGPARLALPANLAVGRCVVRGGGPQRRLATE